MKKLAILFLILIALATPTVNVVQQINFNRECAGHLELASVANSVELAKSELAIAVHYLEQNNITHGYTSIIYTTPDEDVGFFYKNLITSLKELKELPSNATSLEKSNVLMKLRETLVKGSHLVYPDGLALYPHNTAFAVFKAISFIAFVVVALLMVMRIGDWP